ncbi:MAG: N-acetylmuramoyl-L-alanine amidase [Betaproteobacteria bacterium]|nr:N-acetylmuramoyl-L-alanine amidase [Betaproteobacteria bacterium]
MSAASFMRQKGAALACIALLSSPAFANVPLRERLIERANAALAQLPKRADVEVDAIRLVDANVDGRAVTLTFSEAVLDLVPGSVDYERAMRRVHVVLNDELRDALPSIEYETRIGEYSLGEWLSALEPGSAPKALTTPPVPAGARSVSGRRIAVSPGHGWYLDGTWKLQRSYYFGIVEDFINFDLIQLLQQRLLSDGAWVRPTRNMDKAAGNGESGNPKWQEAARYHIKALGVPASVWDSSTSDLNDDIRSRPLYANWIDGNGQNAEILISIHNNGGGGTGTETLYDTNNGFGAESKRLADAVHGRIINAIRAQYNAAWPDRRVQGFAGDYGENRLATRPAILIELAFMDRKSPDNDALQDPAFRELVVQAIKQGVADFFGGLQTDAVAPTPPTAVSAKAAGKGAVVLSWSGATDNVGVTGYRVERDGVVVGTAAGSGYVDFFAPANTPITYRIAARDAAGNWSTPSVVTSVFLASRIGRVPAEDSAPMTHSAAASPGARSTTASR